MTVVPRATRGRGRERTRTGCQPTLRFEPMRRHVTARPTGVALPDGAAPLLAVALSGGGARCFAQLGVIEVLARSGIDPAAASASSSSAFLAALWAAGHPPSRIFEILIAAALELPFDIDLRRGLLGHAGLGRALAPHLPERFEDLGKPLAVVAIDADSGERVVLDSGPLLPALLASNAFPGLFTPIRLDGRLLIDGGGVEMVPVRTAQERWPHPVLAVDVGPPRSLELPFGMLPDALPQAAVAAATSIAMGWKSYVVTQTELVEYQLRVHPPRWLLRPELPRDVGLFRFDRAAKAVEAGRACALRALPRLLGGHPR